MIISHPFLPRFVAGESDSGYVERSMQQPPYQALHVTALAGSFPVSGSMLWHNGLHIVAPHEDGRYLAVRAVADGTVLYIRSPAKRSDEPTHAQNYTCTGRSEWSDNGCVILEHTTDIGGNAGHPIRLTYYSLTMHLSVIDPAVKLNGKVYRKDVIGQPGSACGCQPMIHFEICFDKPNLTVLLGRDPVWDEHEKPRTPTHHGRTDVVFGDTLIYLPVGTPYSVTEPGNAFWDRGHAFTLQQPIWVRMRYEKGQAELSCYDHTGKPIGAALREKDAEYKLYQTAVDQHANAVRTSPSVRSSPSGYYELRRFGRNLGPDPLPPDATHWRQIQPANTAIWVDLNAPGSFKHSDGDFPTFCGYGVFDDDTDLGDQRCQSQRLNRWIQDPDPNNPKRHDPDHKPNRLGLPEVQKKMRRAICYFPSEWDQATIEKRFAWILDPKNTKWPVDKAGWNSFINHAKAMSMTDLPMAYKNAIWRMHPTEFIQTMKKCTWLSEAEFMQLVPQTIVRGVRPGMKGPFIYENTTSLAGSLIKDHAYDLNKMMRKFGIATPPRMCAFLANSIQETTWWSNLEEGDGKNLGYAPWYGRGFLQLTNPNGKFEIDSNYHRYFQFKSSTLPAFTPALLRQWRESISENRYDACASAGAYWAWMSANNLADQISENFRVVIVRDSTRGILPGRPLAIYGNSAFRRVACAINLPAHINNPDPQLRGLVDQYSGYTVAQIILMDNALFPNANGRMVHIPENFVSKRK